MLKLDTTPGGGGMVGIWPACSQSRLIMKEEKTRKCVFKTADEKCTFLSSTSETLDDQTSFPTTFLYQTEMFRSEMGISCKPQVQASVCYQSDLSLL